MMTVNEAIQAIQGRKAGIMNRLSAKYAQTLLHPDETVTTAVVANIMVKGERFPGVVVLTDRRIMAVCGLPGIKRSIVCDLDALSQCIEAPTALNYKATFSDGKNAFAFTVNPEIGEKFSRFVAILNGEEDDFDAVEAKDSGIFNPALMRSKERAKKAKDKARAQHAANQEELRARRAAAASARQSEDDTDGESLQETAQRLNRQLNDARSRSHVEDTDPQAVAARLAAELAAQDTQQES